MGKSRGIFGTTLFHGIILVIVIFLGFIVPDPPPEEEGILINFGTEETGLGDQEPMYSETPEETLPLPQEAATPEETNEEIIAQDFEEAPAVKTQKVEERKEVKEVPREEKPVLKEEVTPPVEEPPKVDERALYRGRSNTDETSGSEGITQGEGNQGSITGSPDSDNYLDGLSSGKGKFDFSLAGRNPVFVPKPEYNVQEAGKVVVRIRVNREGIVTYAEAGVQGTNTLNKELLEAARKAALKARFNSSPDAAFTQQGTITYYFVLE